MNEILNAALLKEKLSVMLNGMEQLIKQNIPKSYDEGEETWDFGLLPELLGGVADMRIAIAEINDERISRFHHFEIWVPTHWLAYLINGDATGFSLSQKDKDENACYAFEKEYADKGCVFSFKEDACTDIIEFNGVLTECTEVLVIKQAEFDID